MVNEPTPDSSAASCDTEGQALYGPVDGTVSSSGNSPDGDTPIEIAASSFDVTVTFENPEATPWEYGVAFIDGSDGSINAIVFKDDGIWLHALSRDGDRSSREIIDGNSLLGLMTGPGDLNELRLYVDDGSVEVNINDSNLTNIGLDIPDDGTMTVEPVYGFTQDGLAGSARYEDFTVTCS